MKNPRFNASGCKDLTAFEAIKNVASEEQEVNKRATSVLSLIKKLLKLMDFELLDRIQIKDKGTGKEFK